MGLPVCLQGILFRELCTALITNKGFGTRCKRGEVVKSTCVSSKALEPHEDYFLYTLVAPQCCLETTSYLPRLYCVPETMLNT
jgi:hypothetical protein